MTINQQFSVIPYPTSCSCPRRGYRLVLKIIYNNYCHALRIRELINQNKQWHNGGDRHKELGNNFISNK